MPALIACLAVGILFLVIFLRALLRETQREDPRYALLLHLSRAAEPEWRRAAGTGKNA